MSSRVHPAIELGGGLLVICLALGACGGGNTNDQSAATPNAPSALSTSSATTSSGAGTGTANHVKVEYPSGGPGGPIFPPGTKAYDLLAKGDCGSLLHEITTAWGQPTGPDQTSEQVDLGEYLLYRTAAEICLQQWDAATADFGRLQARPPDFTSSDCPQANDDPCARCLQVVDAWVKDLIQRWQADPSFTPEFVTGNPGQVCPTTTSTSSSSSSSSTSTSSTSSSSTSDSTTSATQ